MSGIHSMTGFASRDGRAADGVFAWEIRGVNGRGLDLRLRLPESMAAIEQPVRKALGGRLSRGNVTVGLRLRREGTAAAEVDPEALSGLLSAVRHVENAAKDAGIVLRGVSAAELLSWKGVFGGSSVDDEPTKELEAALMAGFGETLNAFVASRAEEGRALAEVLAGQLDRIERLAGEAERAAAERTPTLARRMREHLAAISAETELDPDRVAQELAVLAVKADVTEEIDRIRAHVAAARARLVEGGAVGRKLDFLTQEFNREANTLCSKSGDTALTAVGLELKAVIERMREQVQNIE